MDSIVSYTFCLGTNSACKAFTFQNYVEDCLDKILRHYPSISTSHFVDMEGEMAKLTIEFTIVAKEGGEVSIAKMDILRISNYLLGDNDSFIDNMIVSPLPMPLKPLILTNNQVFVAPNKIPVRPRVEVSLESDDGKEEEKDEEIDLNDDYWEWHARSYNPPQIKQVPKEIEKPTRIRKVTKKEPKKEEKPKRIIIKKPTKKGPTKGKKGE